MIRALIQKIRSFQPRSTYSRVLGSIQYKKTTRFLTRRPFASFFVALGLLFLLILLGSIAGRRGETEPQKELPVKEVTVYRIGETPTVTLQAKIEKKGVIKIVALTPGVVSSIPVAEGDTVSKGQTLVKLASNYQGGNAQALQSQLAGAQYRNVKTTFAAQKELIQKQREVTEKTRENTEELRKISEQSIGETRGLLTLNEQILDSLNDQLDQLEKSNAPEESITAVRGQKAQLEAGINQLRSSLRNLEYATKRDNPPTELADLQKDITLKQLDLQEKALQLNKEVSGIQYNLALLNESLMYPSSPFPAVVERVHVQIGQSVNPGTPLVTISCLEVSATAVVNTPRNIALSISRVEPSFLHIGKKKIAITPTYISTVATDGQLYSVIYDLPDGVIEQTTDDGYVAIDIPVGVSDTSGAIPYIPIDAVYQSQETSYVTVVKKGTAETKSIELGTVYGKYVEVTSGLTTGDQVILNRNVISGDKVRIVTK